MIKLVCNSCDGAYDSLDIRFTKKCDNNCAFCIEKQGLPGFETNVDALVKSTIDSGIKNILILGGEPFLEPSKLLEYVSRIRDYADKIYITTALPNTFNTNPYLINNIIQKIDGLNVSLQSVDQDTNNQILRSSKPYNRLSVLEGLNHIYSDKIRVSLNLVKGGIDDKYRLQYSLTMLNKIGTKSVKLNELQGAEDLYVSFESIIGCKLASPYAHGCQTEIDVRLFGLGNFDMKVIVKRSCFMVNHKLSPSWSDLVKLASKLIWEKQNKFKVLYENGRLCNSWVKLNLIEHVDKE